MRLKFQPEDFRVRELLAPGAVGTRGEHRVYRVVKRKLSSTEAAACLAREAGVPASEVSLAGLKDRQGETEQHMSLPRGPLVHVRAPDLRIEPIGRCDEPIASARVLGNAFAITVRSIAPAELARLDRNAPEVREHGLPNYFDAQRFGNLRYRQGWIARDLARGDDERALHELLCSTREMEGGEYARAKRAWHKSWGNWDACLRIAKRFGRHRALFEHLCESPEDFRGAFRHVATRERLIHLYAWQSHLWNRGVAELIGQCTPRSEIVTLRGAEGPLPCYRKLPEIFSAGATFRLPGAGLEDVVDQAQLAIYEELLARERMVPDQFRIEGIPGFDLKGEDRALVLSPGAFRIRGPRPDPLFRGREMVELEFELPRGTYATLVARRLFAGERAEKLGRAHGRRGRERRDDRTAGEHVGGRFRRAGGGQRGERVDAKSDERAGGERGGRAARRGPTAVEPPRAGGAQRERGDRAGRGERGDRSSGRTPEPGPRRPAETGVEPRRQYVVRGRARGGPRRPRT